MGVNILMCSMVIVERTYVVSLVGGRNALEEFGITESRIPKEQDRKWSLSIDYMEENGYEPDLDNEKFTPYR